MMMFYANGWKRIDEDWEKELLFSEQLLFIHLRNTDWLLPFYLSVQEGRREGIVISSGKGNG